MKGLVWVGLVGVVVALAGSPLAAAQSSGYNGDSRRLVISPREHRWYAYKNGRVVRTGVASTGANYCPDIRRSCRTPQGTFRVVSKGGPGCRSSRYPVGRGGAPMPYCMFFTQYYAVHGSYDVPKNHNASHGCVRIYPSDARWMSQDFLRIGDPVTVGSY